MTTVTTPTNTSPDAMAVDSGVQAPEQRVGSPVEPTPPERPLCEMQCSLKQEQLLNALTTVIKAVSTRSTLPILTHILVEACPSTGEGASPAHVILNSTNLEVGIELRVDARVDHAGAFTIPAKPLMNAIQAFPKGAMVDIRMQEPRVLITCGTRTFSLKGGREADEFPNVVRDVARGEDALCSIGSKALRRAINEVQFAASDNDSRPVFYSICLHVKEGEIDLVAAEQKHLALSTIDLSPKKAGRDISILVPVSSMRLLALVLPKEKEDVPVNIVWNAKRAQAVFQVGPLEVVTRLVEGMFPDYASIVPRTHETRFTVECKDLEQIVASFKLVAADDSHALRVSTTTSGSVAFHAESEALGEADAELSTKVEGKRGEILFNIQSLAAILKFVDAQRFTFMLSGPNRPATLVPTDRGNAKYVLMPMTRKH